MQIPAEQRYPDLKVKLNTFAAVTHELRQKQPALTAREPYLFFSFVRPWLTDSPSTDQIAIKKIASELGFDGEMHALEIRKIFDFDKHLNECCGTTVALAYALDDLYIRLAADLMAEGTVDRLTDLFGEFSKIVYEQGPYTKIAYSHLFNFSSSFSTIDLGLLKIRELNSSEIGSILGRPTIPTEYLFLQPPRVGAFFVVQEEVGAVSSVFDWLLDRHFGVVNLFRVVQYQKTGVVHVDYSVPHFKPAWVNQLRKFGLFFVGNPRRLPYLEGKNPFLLEENDVPPIRKKLKAYVSPPISDLMADESSLFRQSSLRAGDYYEASLTYERPVERLLALAIALEALFSPGDSHEYSFRISQTASQLLGELTADRIQIYTDLRKMYDRRSELMHGTYKVKDVYDGTFVTHQQIDIWSKYIREGVLRFLTLYFRGKRTAADLKALRDDLLKCALDPAAAQEIRKASDVESFLEELEAKKAKVAS